MKKVLDKIIVFIFVFTIMICNSYALEITVQNKRTQEYQTYENLKGEEVVDKDRIDSKELLVVNNESQKIYYDNYYYDNLMPEIPEYGDGQNYYYLYDYKLYYTSDYNSFRVTDLYTILKNNYTINKTPDGKDPFIKVNKVFTNNNRFYVLGYFANAQLVHNDQYNYDDYKINYTNFLLETSDGVNYVKKNININPLEQSNNNGIEICSDGIINMYVYNNTFIAYYTCDDAYLEERMAYSYNSEVDGYPISDFKGYYYTSTNLSNWTSRTFNVTNLDKYSRHDTRIKMISNKNGLFFSIVSNFWPDTYSVIDTYYTTNFINYNGTKINEIIGNGTKQDTSYEGEADKTYRHLNLSGKDYYFLTVFKFIDQGGCGVGSNGKWGCGYYGSSNVLDFYTVNPTISSYSKLYSYTGKWTNYNWYYTWDDDEENTTSPIVIKIYNDKAGKLVSFPTRDSNNKKEYSITNNKYVKFTDVTTTTGFNFVGIYYDENKLVVASRDYSKLVVTPLPFKANDFIRIAEGVNHKYVVIGDSKSIAFEESDILDLLTDKTEVVAIDVTTPKAKISSNNNKVTVSWNHQDASIKTRIYRSTDKKKWTALDTVIEDSYIDTKVTYGKTYYYKVRTYGNGKWSAYSNIVGKKVVPNKVKNLIAISAGSNNIKLGWDYLGLTGYYIQISSDCKTYKKLKAVSSDVLAINSKSLKANKVYCYRIRAYKKVSGTNVYGPWSDVLKTKTAPQTPTLKLVIKDVERIYIGVGTSKGATSYKIEKSIDGKTYEALTTLTDTNNYILENAELGKRFYIRVKACSKYGCSGYTSSNIISTLRTPKLTLTTSSKRVTITVGEVNQAETYYVYRSDSKNGKYTLIKTINSGEEMTFKDKTKKGKTYYYKVRASKQIEEKPLYSYYSTPTKIVSK